MKTSWFALVLCLLLAGSVTAQQAEKKQKMTAEERVKSRIERIDKSVTLTAEQKTQLESALLKISIEQEKLRAEKAETREKWKALRAEEKAVFTNTLTEAQQEKLKAQKDASRVKKEHKHRQAPAKRMAE
jgi:hypothetical protein